ncbi:beta-lactamase family protein [Pseudomonas sp. R2.Fl]|nr:beta-lactamase family protein [Pseudomonas sp. R2.Fl]
MSPSLSRLILLSCLTFATPAPIWAAPATLTYHVPASAGDGWAVADAARQGWKPERFAALEAAITRGDFPGVTSVLVAQDGHLLYERYFNGGDPDVLNDTRSATKSVTALLVGAAIDRGLIPDARAHVHDYFRDQAPWQHDGPRKRAITLEDLLTMSSAWDCDDENPFSSGNEERMYVSENWTRFALDLPLRGYAPWVKRPEDSPHGRTFSYCTAGSFLLGAVLERATGKPLAAFAAEALDHPLGISQVQWNRSSEGVGMGGGGTRYRSRDLAKLGQLVAAGGIWNGKRVISADWIRQALTVHAQAREDADYGYQFWRFRFTRDGREQPAWAMSGNGGNYVFIVPEKKLVAVITRTSFNQRDVHPQSQRMFGDYVLTAMP